jgi:hypothetical protein
MAFEFNETRPQAGCFNARSKRKDAKAPSGPESIGEILSRVFALRGWGRRQERMRLEAAWVDAIGPKLIERTRVGSLRRGALEIIVDNAVLLQELAHFQKRRLLERLRASLPGVTLTELRFRAGTVSPIGQ